jgi:hypothetical protein
MLPCADTISHHPSTQPGTVQDSGPFSGIATSPRDAYSATEADLGAGPLPFKARTVFVFAE